jgi:hypothetical protein
MMIARSVALAIAHNTRCNSSSSSSSSVLTIGKKIASRCFSANSVSTLTEEQMKTDKRYATTVKVPESLQHDNPTAGNKYSIRGAFREGRAAYLDLSATTPIDPRVLDAMLPYMVSLLGVLLSFLKLKQIDVVSTLYVTVFQIT